MAAFGAVVTRTILWVDDFPVLVKQAASVLAAMQVAVVHAHTTERALEHLKTKPFDAIVSDMGRREGPIEGYVLLDEVRRRGFITPYFIYATDGGRAAHVALATERGANGSAGSMTDLLAQLHGTLFPNAHST